MNLSQLWHHTDLFFEADEALQYFEGSIDKCSRDYATVLVTSVLEGRLQQADIEVMRNDSLAQLELMAAIAKCN